MTSTDLMEAIAERIAALWPERMLYRDFCPKDYKRPSGFLYVINAGFEDVNIGLVRWSVEAELELFAATEKIRQAAQALFSLRVEREHYPALVAALRDALLSPEEYRLYYVDHTQIKEMKEG